MRTLRMLAFHTRLFAGNSYFVQLMITSTVTILLMQYVASFASQSPESASSAWLRAGLVGTWTVCTVAAGLIGFQRFQGTLVHLVFTPTRAGSTLLPLIGSASAFGLLAFRLLVYSRGSCDFIRRLACSWCPQCSFSGSHASAFRVRWRLYSSLRPTP